MITVLLMIAYRYYSWASYSLFHLEGDFGSLYILIPAAILELFILYKVVKHSRIKKNASWSKVIVIIAFTDLLYLAALILLMYVLAAIQICTALSECSFF